MLTPIMAPMTPSEATAPSLPSTSPLKSAIQRKTEDNDVPVNGDDAKNAAKNISQRQRNILELIQKDPTISLDSIAKAIGVSAPTIDREIVKMSHLIKHVEPKKGGHWEIINNS